MERAVGGHLLFSLAGSDHGGIAEGSVQKTQETGAKQMRSHNITILQRAVCRGKAAKVIAPNEPINTGGGRIGRGHKKPAPKTPGIVLQGDFVYTD